MKWFKTSFLALVVSGALTFSGYGAVDVFSVKTAAQPALQNECAIAIPSGEILEFSAADLERRMGLAAGSLSGMTVTALPGSGEGELVLFGVEVEPYQFLTRDELDELCFVPGYQAVAASLTMLPQGVDSKPTQISIQMLAAENAPPIAEGMSLETVKDTPLYGAVQVTDPDGDSTRVVVLTAPKKGEVVFRDHSFVYTPFRGQTGNDRFVFSAIDRFGNYSAEAVVEIKIEPHRSGFYYVDMAGNPAAYAAIKLQEKGVLSGRLIGNGWFFQPQREVTRGELLVMVLAAAGMDGDLPPTVNTGLANDESLPLWLKPYLRRAIDEDIWDRDRSFLANEVPTRAEAVQMVAMAAGIDDVRDYSLQMGDIADIPDWAVESYKELAAYRMLDLYDGNAYPHAAMDNAYAATLLWQLYKHMHR